MTFLSQQFTNSTKASNPKSLYTMIDDPLKHGYNPHVVDLSLILGLTDDEALKYEFLHIGKKSRDVIEGITNPEQRIDEKGPDKQLETKFVKEYEEDLKTMSDRGDFIALIQLGNYNAAKYDALLLTESRIPPPSLAHKKPFIKSDFVPHSYAADLDDPFGSVQIIA